MSTDGRVRGAVDSDFLSGKISKTSFDAATNKLKFVLESEMGAIVYEATVAGDEMTGTLGIEDAFSTGFKATRVVSDPEGAENAAEASTTSDADAASTAGQSGE